MSLKTHVDEFEGCEITVKLTQFSHGGKWTVEVAVSQGERRFPPFVDRDHSYATEDEARNAGVQIGRNLIRGINGK
ncbi:DUF6566 family protein [Burkholderia gladioli]|nr:DUF6566 family protein [Burkholderia gladioli]